MSSNQPKVIRGKRKHLRKAPQFATAPKVMADDRCEEESSIQESGSDDVGVVKRAKSAKVTTMSPKTEIADDQDHNQERGEQAEGTSPCPKVGYLPPGFLIFLIRKTDEKFNLQATADEKGQLSFDTDQLQVASLANHQHRFNDQFWKDEYCKLKEIHHRREDEVSEELITLKNKLKASEEDLEQLRRDKFCGNKEWYPREFGFVVDGIKLKRNYNRITTAIDAVCGGIWKQVLPSTFDTMSSDPEYCLIAREGTQSWIRKLLTECDRKKDYVPVPRWVIRRMITRYVLRIFEPMLVGMDQEVESLLQRVRDNMNLRMVPIVADRWMGDTLRSYTLLPKYEQDRDYYLRSHTEHLRGFVEWFVPDPKTTRRTRWEKSALDNRENMQKNIIELAADLAAEMSFSYLRYEVDWNYCDKKTEIFEEELVNHEVFHLDGGKLYPENFPGFGKEEKIGDVVMFIRPPIVLVERATTRRQIVGQPHVVVKPVPNYDSNAKLG